MKEKLDVCMDTMKQKTYLALHKINLRCNIYVNTKVNACISFQMTRRRISSHP
jgi:hypothetical protein